MTALRSKPSEIEGAPRRTFADFAVTAALAALLASVIDLVVFWVARWLWDVPAGFSALNPLSIVIVATVGSVVAAVGLIVLVRVMRRARSVFLVLLTLVTLLSLAGPLQALRGGIPNMPPATVATGVTMMFMHLLTGGLIAAVLLVRTR